MENAHSLIRLPFELSMVNVVILWLNFRRRDWRMAVV
jgi:hypothetical protein